MRGERKPARRGEFDFIARLRSKIERRQAAASTLDPPPSSLVLGIGDDAAVLGQHTGSETVITTDLLVEGVDFDLDNFKTAPRDIGHKALAVSLSDIAAMGARPRFALLSVGVPRARWETPFLDRFYQGVFALADAHGVSLVGGDISRTPERVVVDSIVLGEVARGRAVLRSGARAGDLVYVTGALGGAAAGLRLLQQRARTGEPVKLNRSQRQLVLRQTRPTPRVAWGRLLGERRLATAMIDLSDGLSSDLAHLCRESGVGALVEASRLPLDPHLSRSAPGAEALPLALHGGEDFELLFTVRPRDAAKLPREVEGVRAARVGFVTAAAGRVRLQEGDRVVNLKPAGFEHFERS